MGFEYSFRVLEQWFKGSEYSFKDFERIFKAQ